MILLAMRLLLMALMTATLAAAQPRPREQVTPGGPEAQLMCHICEVKNNYLCENPVPCEWNETYCLLVALRIDKYNVLVSKTCSLYCPFTKEIRREFSASSFEYAQCCSRNLCNMPSSGSGPLNHWGMLMLLGTLGLGFLTPRAGLGLGRGVVLWDSPHRG
ncbi:lymphocyte antigen 6K [Tachyglossus aculeatus]|uniref:lymphocyte antigen 6K n=1 Tax=Tachyglossus aculeatus TaxID=9261 RepID=UPI0018F3402B|nr:lymphocyte antigen 6K [Tachyglossus aculeatus]